MRLVMLGLPPATNNMYATVPDKGPKTGVRRRAARVVLSAAGRASHKAWRAVAARKHAGPPSGAPFAVLVVYHLHRLDRDVDGSHKAVLDGFKGVLWRDDKQVVLLGARKDLAPREVFPYVTVVVRELAAMPSYRPQEAPGGALAFETNIWPPTTNNAYALSGGRRRKTAAARAAGDAYTLWMSRLVRHPPAIEGPARLRIRYGIAVDRRDVEGSHKILVDAMRGVAWRDDADVMSFSVSKARLPKGAQPVIDVVTWAMPGARQGRP